MVRLDKNKVDYVSVGDYTYFRHENSTEFLKEINRPSLFSVGERETIGSFATIDEVIVDLKPHIRNRNDIHMMIDSQQYTISNIYGQPEITVGNEKRKYIFSWDTFSYS